MSVPVIALVDYGAGNLTSVVKGLETAGASVRVVRSPGDLAGAAAIVIPGVGHFEATSALDEPWRSAVIDASRRGVPILGICLGMQWLFEGSDEAPEVPGLGLIHGRCRRLPPTLKVPHVGWNELEIKRPSRLLAGIASRTQAYFTHSYAADVTDEAVVAWTNTYNGKTKVFATTLGHNNTTVGDDRYLDLVARGLLWSVGKLDEAHLVPAKKVMLDE